MLFRELLQQELKSQSDDFKRFAENQAHDLNFYINALTNLSQKNFEELEAQLRYHENIGALPSEELKRARNFAFAFPQEWTNHEDARRWAHKILHKRTTFAADGSQLFLEREISFPVGAVQIGWFENPHDDLQSYEKNAKFFVISPEELLSPDEPFLRETLVGQRRFAAEIEKVIEFMKKKSGWRKTGEPMPLAFYDNTLLLSISLPQQDFQSEFIDKLVNLVNVSIETKIPLVGYVDRSYARDLINLLNYIAETEDKNTRKLDDASILHASVSQGEKTLKSWGDRTVFCYSKRRGLNAFINPQTQKSIVGFCYLQTTFDNPPARLDIPAWIYEEGFLDEVLDVVRAECVIGLGYPYALETADQTAVITMRDREIFLQALQGFAVENNLGLSISKKAASKGRRR